MPAGRIRDATDPPGVLVVVMGVAGSGKSTVGALVAAALALPFVEGDEFHDAANVERMRAGLPLDEAMRTPWLDRLHAALDAHRTGGAVLACSALTVAARERLASGLAVRFAYLEVPPAVLADRLRRRHGHFAGEQLLASQLATLEIRPDIVTIDGNRPAPDVAAEVVAAVRSPAT